VVVVVAFVVVVESHSSQTYSVVEEEVVEVVVVDASEVVDDEVVVVVVVAGSVVVVDGSVVVVGGSVDVVVALVVVGKHADVDCNRSRITKTAAHTKPTYAVPRHIKADAFASRSSTSLTFNFSNNSKSCSPILSFIVILLI
jgi:hypothetical protein